MRDFLAEKWTQIVIIMSIGVAWITFTALAG